MNLYINVFKYSKLQIYKYSNNIVGKCLNRHIGKNGYRWQKSPCKDYSHVKNKYNKVTIAIAM